MNIQPTMPTLPPKVKGLAFTFLPLSSGLNNGTIRERGRLRLCSNPPSPAPLENGGNEFHRTLVINVPRSVQATEPHSQSSHQQPPERGNDDNLCNRPLTAVRGRAHEMKHSPGEHQKGGCGQTIKNGYVLKRSGRRKDCTDECRYNQ